MKVKYTGAAQYILGTDHLLKTGDIVEALSNEVRLLSRSGAKLRVFKGGIATGTEFIVRGCDLKKHDESRIGDYLHPLETVCEGDWIYYEGRIGRVRRVDNHLIEFLMSGLDINSTHTCDFLAGLRRYTPTFWERIKFAFIPG